jgi:Mg2+/Co2+ transporter CorB
MLASSLTGFIWFQFGATTAFIATATVTVLVIVYFLTIPKPIIATDEISQSQPPKKSDL